MTVKITHIGQEFWYVPSSRYSYKREIKVVSIGRKWAQLSEHRTRADISTGEVDGGEYSSPGKLYNSKEEYDDALMRLSLIARFERAVRGGWALKAVPAENIIAAAKLLGISLDVPSTDKVGV